MKTIKFPEDFVKKSHGVLPGATQWLYNRNDGNHNIISIVGGGLGLYGDGVESFEMWDTKYMNDPQGYMTKEEIQTWLDEHPIEGE
jgi:hypothetical protein